MTAGESAPRSRRADRKPHRRRAAPRGEDSLQAPDVPGLRLPRHFTRYVIIAAALILLISWFVWYATTPPRLDTTEKAVSANGVVGAPLYVGMYSAPQDFERTLRISGVKVHATTNADIDITPVLCRRGTVGVTSEPEQFCSELVDPEGARLVGGDSIILKVESAEAAVAIVDQIKVAYREDLRWDTQVAGHQQAIITLTARPTAGDGLEEPAPGE